MGNLEKEEWSKNGVIVTVYEELSSSTNGSRFQKKIRTTNHPNTKKRSCGYDRHAELLAYAHQLRQQANSQQIHDDDHIHNSTQSNLRKPKKRRLLGGLKGLKLSIGRIFEGETKRATKYERVESCPSHPPPGKWKGSWSKISKTLCCVLKQCSSVSKCCKGFDHNESDLHNTNQR